MKNRMKFVWSRTGVLFQNYEIRFFIGIFVILYNHETIRVVFREYNRVQ